MNNPFDIIQFDIEKLDWANKKNFFFFNSEEKTKHIILSNSHPQQHPIFCYKEWTVINKQPGLLTDENWEHHINYTISKTRKIIHMFELFGKRLHFCSSEKFYEGKTASIIDYGCMFYN